MSFLFSYDLTNLKDEDINALYPIKMQKLSSTHWTPVDIAKKAIRFLAEDGRKVILDLGSGSGKFCLVAAACSDAIIVGVEQRENLVQLSRKVAKSLSLHNLKFIHADLVEIDFEDYDSFYFFNAFEEFINPKDKMDKTQELDEFSYKAYIQLIHQKFDQALKGLE
ncbi:class I SAM-dependent methyltransferase [Algoriphagus sp. D3-2-R+10]|uniref:class I SAM-dependent methyltransferase n=1 Tax=Algoriphagus aurantiacus TaxID=3103948 RepID=UPI002B3A5740|nr:class I SAM-dependent methyltransferase [Algoriphagus sp. D3-2-R+10]MEB2775198.1 class I SAM-dependent methyltransferase [Algoriphagus sp. D3-2-R+10]